MPDAKPKAGKSLADFRASHDKNFIVPQRIQTALKKLGDGWEYEVDFIKLAGLCTTDLARFRDQFEDYFVTTNGKNPKRVWTGSKAVAQQMREMVT